MISLDFNYIRKQPDNLLKLAIEYIMKKGETTWFEVKRGLPRGQIKKLPKTVSSIANSGGGLIFYGWDEEKGIFSNIEIDDCQSVILQQSKKCKPVIPLEFHTTTIEDKQCLIVGIPALRIPVKDENDVYYLRIGSHTREIEESELLSTVDHFQRSLEGHLYIEDFLETLKQVKRDFFCTEIQSESKELEKLGGELFFDISKNWIIIFQEWLGESPLEYPIRIHFNKWKKNLPSSESWNLSIKIMKWIDNIFAILESIEEMNLDELKRLIRDKSFRIKKETNHRRCLTTLVNQENLWNFTDDRIFIKKENGGYTVFQNEAEKNIETNISKLNKLDKDSVEKEILNHNRKKCVENSKRLVQNIILEIEKLESSLCIN